MNVLRRRLTNNMEQFLGPDPAAIPDLFAAISERPGSNLERIATAVLRKFAPGVAKPILSDLEKGLDDSNATVRLWSTTLLRFLGPEAKPMQVRLEQLMDSPDHGVPEAAAVSLAAIGPESLPVLLAKMEADPKAAWYLAECIGGMRPSAELAVPKLVAVLEKGDPRAQRSVLVALTRFGPAAKGAVPALAKFLADQNNTGLNKETVDALVAIGPDAVSAMGEMLGQGADAAQNLAAKVLSLIGPTSKAAVPKIAAALAQENKQTLSSLLAALVKIGPDAIDAVPTLAKLMAAQPQNARYSEVVLAILRTESVPVPAEVQADLLANGTDDLRLKMAESLAKLGPAAKAVAPQVAQVRDQLDAELPKLAADRDAYKTSQELVFQNPTTGSERRITFQPNRPEDFISNSRLVTADEAATQEQMRSEGLVRPRSGRRTSGEMINQLPPLLRVIIISQRLQSYVLTSASGPTNPYVAKIESTKKMRDAVAKALAAIGGS